jgi:hypothetical protein
LDNFIIPFETSAVRIKIIIVALVIGLVWGGGRDSDKDSKESTSHLFITASEECCHEGFVLPVGSKQRSGSKGENNTF